ncbi:MAG: hypothetical protein P1U35_02785 [Cycloclasticus sp.]|nr:hypothetical protein [Cycloclasticus sp.]
MNTSVALLPNDSTLAKVHNDNNATTELNLQLEHVQTLQKDEHCHSSVKKP